MKVIQCWDDGVTTDIRLTGILRKHNAKASFNLNFGLHENKRSGCWDYQGTTVCRLSRADLATVYDGFLIANHSLTHPWLEKLTMQKAYHEILQNRLLLQDLFQQPVLGFAYPFGTYNRETQRIIEDTGHLYARTTEQADPTAPPDNHYLFHPSCHVLDNHFWDLYQNAKKSGVFYFWGHSYEMTTETMWTNLEHKIQRINDDPNTSWANIPDIF